MGPLKGLRVVEIAGLGPAPFCGMLLADLGADVLRIDRKGGPSAPIPLDPSKDVLARGRRSLAVDLKHPEGVELVLKAVEAADVLFEGFRPGVAERLGLGPEDCLRRNPRLVYGRMTGWGQQGPLAPRAGHDINYIALSGALSMIGPAGEKPHPPINLVGDMGGGGMLLALGILAAVIEARASGLGQVVDAAMIDGAALMMSSTVAMRAMGFWSDRRGTNLGDTGAHFYNTYETADGEYMAVGAIEPQFYEALCQGAGLDRSEFDKPMDPRRWPALIERLAAIFRTKTRAEWTKIFEDVDACVTPVLSLDEAPRHRHAQARNAFCDINGVIQPAPAPRFSRTPAGLPSPPPETGVGGENALRDWGVPAELVAAQREAGVVL